MVTGLTRRQAEILALIRATIRRTGMPPTRSEIAQACGFRSANAAEEHLRALARKGAIELLPGASRGIRLPGDDALGTPGLPVIGRVAAGQPLLAVEQIETYQRIDPAVFRPRADYLLRVRGTSMRDAGILDGDLLAVHATRSAGHGQIVVARLEDEVTVKRLCRQGRRVQLVAANPDFAPIDVLPGAAEWIIEGLAVGVLRTQLS